MIGVIGFRFHILSNIGGNADSTISCEYITGVKNCQAIATMDNIYSKSLKYTVKADAINAIPNANKYSTIIIIGNVSIAFTFIPNPVTIMTPKITTKLKSIFTKEVVIYGGEYAELSDITISAWDVVEGSNTLETEED